MGQISLGQIERAIQKSDIGLVPANDGNVIRMAIPHLTEERRRELVKLVRKMAEEKRISIRGEQGVMPWTLSASLRSKAQ